MVFYQIGQVLHRELGITNDELSIILVKGNWDVKQIGTLSVGGGQQLVCA